MQAYKHPSEDRLNLYLTTNESGAICVCDENGRIVSGSVSLMTDKAFDGVTMATLEFYPCGFIDRCQN